jgi:integrase
MIMSGKHKRQRGTGSIYRRAGSKNWMLKYTNLDGTIENYSSGTADEQKAKSMLKTELARITRGETSNPQANKITVGELYADFLAKCEREHYRDVEHVKTRWEGHLKPAFGGLLAVQARKQTFENYASKRQSEGASDGTINRELSIVRAAFYHAELPQMPKFYQLKEANRRTGFLDDNQYSRLADETGKVGLWLRAMFETAYSFGWRSGGLKQMRVSQVDLLAGTITLSAEQSKNKDAVTAPVDKSSILYKLLVQCVSGKEQNAYLFSRDARGRAPVKSFRKSWENACKNAGVESLLFHDLRRTARRNMRRAGVADDVVMQIGGWKTLVVSRRYDIIDAGDLRDAARKIAEHTVANSRLATVSATVAPDVVHKVAEIQ